MTTTGLQAGAASADITPTTLAGLNAMGPDFLGIHDTLQARALVLVNGDAAIAIVTVDLLEVGLTVALRERIADETGIPSHAVLIAPSHSHNAPRAGQTPPGGLSRAASPESLEYTETVFAAVVQLVGEARAATAPARVGIGRGAVDVNVHRDVLVDGVWRLGQNPEGPSDKALTVIAVQGRDGSVIAVLLDYAVHPTAALGTRLVSADVAGRAAALTGHALGCPVLWLAGALGDQAVRLSFEVMSRNDESPTADAVFAAVDEQGEAISDEAVRVVGGIDEWADDAAVAGAEQLLMWPSKCGTQLPPDMHQEQLDEVGLRLTTLTIGDIALLGVGGEVTTRAAAEILAASPTRHPLLVSMANERLGYLADAEAFRLGTFAARGCPLADGWVPAAARVLANLVEPARTVA